MAGSPSLWWILDPETIWLSMNCFTHADPLACFQKLDEIFQLPKVLGVRLGICVIAVTTGLLAFSQFSTQMNRDH
jgi:hypothetical protein